MLKLLKGIVLVTVLAIGMKSFANYYPNGWFYPHAKDVRCFANPQSARCVIVNSFGAPLFCQGVVFGQSRFGAALQSHFSGWIGAGQSVWAFVNAINPYNDPIIGANVNVQCRF
ncbi:hypothetical protein [Bacteriovorax sp. Seq25_V]|uniref:hypothetical protein n=1 Tax=Bacteriovorax sp. Seq25_V TaxID=1201288 RepID=UPI00038A43DD|nr:hypothetical protein [Bacteriovorax sp. Seq25_V]EQC48008.1 hypothetical protein M900_A0066 [Bacteriovorax sp. Seq25_V]